MTKSSNISVTHEVTHGACTVSIPESPYNSLYEKYKELSKAFRDRSGCLAVSSGQGGKISSRRQISFRKMSSLGEKPETSRDKAALLLVIKLHKPC